MHPQYQIKFHWFHLLTAISSGGTQDFAHFRESQAILGNQCPATVSDRRWISALPLLAQVLKALAVLAAANLAPCLGLDRANLDRTN
jgi:hypothetical protein